MALVVIVMVMAVQIVIKIFMVFMLVAIMIVMVFILVHTLVMFVYPFNPLPSVQSWVTSFIIIGFNHGQ